jgi:hypothetical protein
MGDKTKGLLGVIGLRFNPFAVATGSLSFVQEPNETSRRARIVVFKIFFIFIKFNINTLGFELSLDLLVSLQEG